MKNFGGVTHSAALGGATLCCRDLLYTCIRSLWHGHNGIRFSAVQSNTKARDIPVNSMKGVRNSGPDRTFPRAPIRRTTTPRRRTTTRAKTKRMEEKVGEVKKKKGGKKKVSQLSFARPFPRAIDLADRVANLDSYTSRKDPIVDRATTWLRVFPHRTKML